jgi:hypothetical protein
VSPAKWTEPLAFFGEGGFAWNCLVGDSDIVVGRMDVPFDAGGSDIVLEEACSGGSGGVETVTSLIVDVLVVVVGLIFSKGIGQSVCGGDEV